jgi:hypothetical protein
MKVISTTYHLQRWFFRQDEHYWLARGSFYSIPLVWFTLAQDNNAGGNFAHRVDFTAMQQDQLNYTARGEPFNMHLLLISQRVSNSTLVHSALTCLQSAKTIHSNQMATFDCIYMLAVANITIGQLLAFKTIFHDLKWAFILLTRKWKSAQEAYC